MSQEVELDIRTHLEETVTSMSHVCFSKNVELYLDVRLAHVHFQGDPMRLRQMLTNFLSNAIKFTDKGEIKISIETVTEDDAEAMLKVSCSDTGECLLKVFGFFGGDLWIPLELGASF